MSQHWFGGASDYCISATADGGIPGQPVNMSPGVALSDGTGPASMGEGCTNHNLDCYSYPMTLNDYADEVHAANAKWWHDPATGQPITRNIGEMLMLVTCELAEALEGDRQNLMDDKLPRRKMFEVEIADAVIRLLDIAGGLGLDLHGAYVEKQAYNKVRADHSNAGRLAVNGKKY